MTQIVIGIDGGGSKTQAIVADERGAAISEIVGPGSAVRPGKVADSARVIAEVVRDALASCDMTHVTPRALCVGVAGVGRDAERQELWQALVASARKHQVQWTWVRGHRGHPKNEYANDLAVRAAGEQLMSKSDVVSGFAAWLDAKRSRGHYVDYDPDAAFTELAGGVADA